LQCSSRHEARQATVNNLKSRMVGEHYLRADVGGESVKLRLFFFGFSRQTKAEGLG